MIHSPMEARIWRSPPKKYSQPLGVVSKLGETSLDIVERDETIEMVGLTYTIAAPPPPAPRHPISPQDSGVAATTNPIRPLLG
jgi:hypothetical protein